MGKKTSKKLLSWRKRKARVRARIAGAADRPRLSVYRSSKHIYAQVIDDERGVTLAAASTVDREFDETAELTKSEAARKVGELLAARCIKLQITKVVFDRNGYPYRSGRVVSLADGARSGGLQF